MVQCNSAARSPSFSYTLSYFSSLSTHCSHYAEMNLTNIRRDNYIKNPSTALAMSEAPGGSPVDQVYSLLGNMLNKAYIVRSIQEYRENP